MGLQSRAAERRPRGRPDGEAARRRRDCGSATAPGRPWWRGSPATAGRRGSRAKPGLGGRRGLHGRRPGAGAGRHRRLHRPDRRATPSSGSGSARSALRAAGCAGGSRGQRPGRGAAQRRPPLRPLRTSSTGASSTRTCSTPAPTSRGPDMTPGGGPGSPRSGTSPPSCCSSPARAVLDIGCGWGGMALTLAEEAGVEVDGVTLSIEQLAVAQARAEAQRAWPTGRGSRSPTTATCKGTYDRIVSVGMFEHVGRPNYQDLFRRRRPAAEGRRRGADPLHRPAGGPASPTPGSTSTSSPAATSRRCRRCCRRSSGPA